MTYLQAILLGSLQGLTEFLPVSSSGHLALLQDRLGIREVPLLFDVLLHIATLGVVVIVFKDKILQLIKGFYRILRRKPFAEQEEIKRLIVVLMISTLCTGIIAVPLESWVEQASPKLISLNFILTALLLLFAGTRKGHRTYRELSIWDGVFIGIAQGVGVLPGISRSGITISAGLLRKLERSVAGEYSFVLSIPAILGALVLTLKDAALLEGYVAPSVLLAGMGAAFGTAYFALKLLLRTIRGGHLGWFALYLIPVGIIGIIFL